jgi:hypothetical protein
MENGEGLLGANIKKTERALAEMAQEVLEREKET